ncbi:MAG TPA: chemotaxis protein CheA [Geobacteraceae bacterium]|nr:chemotaxis protein CheA [Geobacteraceae bacterium]
MDMSHYRELFISETREHLRTFSELIVALEKEPDDKENIDSLFRTAHSIKGMAAAMGYSELSTLAHKIEDLMDKVRKKVFPFAPAIADLLLEGSDFLDAMVSDIEANVTADRDFSGLVEKLVGYVPGVPKEAEPPQPGGEKEESPVEKGDVHPESRQTVRVRTEVLDSLINLTGELITNKNRLMNIGLDLASAPLDDAMMELGKLLRELHNEVLNVRMMPFASISNRFPRIIRDLAQKSGKEVAFDIDGKEIELDRGILEQLSDPLVHILRNAVDHGLETGAERQAYGKNEQGRIRLSVSREKDLVVVTVEDDGRGMDPAKLIAAALDKGLIKPEEAKRLSPRDAFLLTCIPGFSTAREVTDVSGRGVGMDAVRSTIRSLGGSIAMDSEVGRGSRITLKLPLTIAIINVLLVKCAGLTLAVPLTSILRTLEIRRGDISSQGRHKLFFLDGEGIPLVSMNRIFGTQAPSSPGSVIPLFVGEVKGRKLGLVVDRFLGQQEVFVKPLGRPLARLKGLAGGATLGNGEVVFILDVANIL